MSNKPHHCAKCQVDGVCDAVVPFEAERENAFAVYWKCPRCEERSLIISPLGPWLAPTAKMCLQCGHDGPGDDQACPTCGIRIAEVLSAEEAERPDEELLNAAREDFAWNVSARADHCEPRPPAEPKIRRSLVNQGAILPAPWVSARAESRDG